MDLISFVAGIGPTASFTPGANTSAPFNTTHTGATDGTSPSTATNNMAEIINRLLLQVASVIVKSGLSIDNTNWAQLGDAVLAMANSGASGKVSTTTYNADFTNSLGSVGSTGFADIKGGLIFHWGSFTCPGGGSNLTITLSPAFPTACIGAVAIGGDSANILSMANGSPPTASSITVNNGGFTGYYLAFGH